METGPSSLLGYAARNISCGIDEGAGGYDHNVGLSGRERLYPRIDVLNCCTTERDCAGVGKVLGKAYTHASVANAMHVCSDGLWRSSSVAIVPTRATACGQSPSRTASSLEYMLFLPYSNTADKLWVLFCPDPERVEHNKLR